MQKQESSNSIFDQEEAKNQQSSHEGAKILQESKADKEARDMKQSLDISIDQELNNDKNQEVSWTASMKEKLLQICTKDTVKKLAIASSIVVAFAMGLSIYNKQMSITEVISKFKNSEFSKVVVWSTFIVCHYKNPGNGQNYVIASKSLFEDQQVMSILKNSNADISSPLINELHITYGIIGCAYSYAVYKILASMRDPHKYSAKQKKDMVNQSSKDFSQVGGCVEAKNALKDIIDCIHNPSLYASAGVKMPRGVLLYGPPGTGKTLIAKAAAKEAGIPVIYCSGSEFVEVFVGLGAKRIRDIFAQARQQSPCMIFIDEIDAVGFSRGNNNYIMGGGHREMETTLNELLNQMDGFEENDKILVVAATNLAATLDPALQRPGRFDQKIEVKLPSQADRYEIFKIHLKNKQHQLQKGDLEHASSLTEGLSGAEIENVVNLAALQAVRKAQSMKLNQIRLEKQEFIDFIESYKQARQNVSNHVGLRNQQPHHYYKQ